MKIKHNGSRTRLYSIYHGIIQRCYKTYCKQYKYYGARGIKVGDEWLGENGFENFRDWSLKNGYTENLSIDRIDNDGNYSPDNCRWTTNKVQHNNTSQNHYLEFNGEKHSVAEWSEITGIKSVTLSTRLKMGWGISDVLSKPIQKKRKRNPETKWLQKDKYGYAIKINNKYCGRAKTLEEAIAKRDSILGVVQ